MLYAGSCSTYGRKTISSTRTSGTPARTYSLSLRGRLNSPVHTVDPSTGLQSASTIWAGLVNLHRRLLVAWTFSLSSSLPMVMTNKLKLGFLSLAGPDRKCQTGYAGDQVHAASAQRSRRNRMMEATKA